MKLNNKTKKIISYIWILSISVLMAVSIFLLSTHDMRKGEQWDKYYTIVSTDIGLIENFLIDEDLDSYISLNKSTVQYNDISSIKPLALSSVFSRFDSIDPRLDPYMKHVKQLFFSQSEGEEYELLYFEKNAISIFHLYWKLQRQFPSDDFYWTISGFKPFEILIPLFLYTLYLLLIVFLSKEKLRNILCFCGWFPFVYLLGLPALATAIALSFFIYRKKSLITITIVILVMILLTFKTAGISSFFIFTIIYGLFSSFYLYFSVSASSVNVKKEQYRKMALPRLSFRKPEHELFSPVKIMSPGTEKVQTVEKPKLLSALAASFIIISMIIPLFHREGDSFDFPIVEELSNLEWTLENTSLTSGNHLSPADYLTHLVFQQGFLFSTEWKYPQVNNPLLYPVFESVDNSFSKSYEIQAEYSEKWFQDQISQLKNDNPAKLLFSTDRPGYVIKKSNVYNYHSFPLLHFSFLMLILFLLIFSNEKRYKYKSFSVKKKLLRRNEQVA